MEEDEHRGDLTKSVADAVADRRATDATAHSALRTQFQQILARSAGVATDKQAAEPPSPVVRRPRANALSYRSDTERQVRATLSAARP